MTRKYLGGVYFLNQIVSGMSRKCNSSGQILSSTFTQKLKFPLKSMTRFGSEDFCDAASQHSACSTGRV